METIMKLESIAICTLNLANQQSIKYAQIISSGKGWIRCERKMLQRLTPQQLKAAQPA
jgi:hypothetical protein